MKDELKKINERHEMLMEKYDFVIHHVFPTDKDDTLFSHHTHGLKENFNHLDLEIALPIPPIVAGGVIHSMVDQIKEGASFENQLVSDKVIQNYNVQLVTVNTDGRELLRIILPDPNGKFPSDEDCADIYKNQLDDINSNII